MDDSKASPWSFAEAPAQIGRADGVTTLVEGQAFCLSTTGGDIDRARSHGLFVFDMRVLSTWMLTVDGLPTEPLVVDPLTPFQATFVSRGRAMAGQADSSLVVFRRRSLGDGMREVLTVRNVGIDRAAHRVQIGCGADFADLFAVKEGRAREREVVAQPDGSNSMLFRLDDGRGRVDTTVRFSDSGVASGPCITWDLDLAPGESEEICLDVSVVLEGAATTMRFGDGDEHHETLPARRLTRWQQTAPTIRSSSPTLDDAVRTGIADLGALRIFDADHSDRAVVAAGAPWFMALFGRDSLLTAWMSLLVDPGLAVGVVETLAALQGTKLDPMTEEAPGKILHEARLGLPADQVGRHAAYYGSADATPLFVMLVGEMLQWGVDPAVIDRMLPHVDAALAWIADHGDRDGDGYVEYHRSSTHGLANQGWKDSWDAIRFADGRLADSPIALCEIQGYVYGAYRARARLATSRHDAAEASTWTAKAQRLKADFNRDFWVDDRGWFALGLDADKQPIDALTSNLGHCLWTGIIDDEHAAAVAARLVAAEMFGGWGVRTLASSMAAYNPVSYHNGSVWPHDTAICAAGLMRYGFVDEAHHLIDGLIDASGHQGGRLPELFAGFGRGELGTPAPYPSSCSPQAWAAAAPLLMVRTLLRLEPDVASGRMWIAPALPSTITRLAVDGISIGNRRVSVRVDGDTVEIDGLSELELVRSARPIGD